MEWRFSKWGEGGKSKNAIFANFTLLVYVVLLLLFVVLASRNTLRALFFNSETLCCFLHLATCQSCKHIWKGRLFLKYNLLEESHKLHITTCRNSFKITDYNLFLIIISRKRWDLSQQFCSYVKCNGGSDWSNAWGRRRECVCVHVP